MYLTAVILLIFVILVDHQSRAACPSSCTCNAAETQLTCRPSASDDVAVIPTVPDTTEELILTGRDRQYFFPTLTADLLASLPVGLTKLQIFSASVASCDVDAFAAFTNLRTLDLSTNRLTEFGFLQTAALAGLSTLNINTQSGNSGIVLNSDHFEGLSDLESLHLESLGLTSFPTEVFGHLPALRTLSLSYNPLRSISLEDFQTAGGSSVLGGIRTLKLASAQLSALPRGLNAVMPQLQIWDLGRNYFSNFTREYYSGFQQLEELYLNSNSISLLPVPSFVGSELPSLRLVNFDATYLTTIPPGAFQNVASLRRLTVQAQLEEVPATLATDTPNLEELVLYRNKISSVSVGDLEDFDHLKLVDLSYNDIQMLDESLSPVIQSIDKFYAYENPYHCNCALAWYYTLWTNSLDNAGVSARFGPASQYKCETGTAFNAGEKFADIDQVGHFTCGAPEVDLITTTGNFMAYGGEIVIKCTVAGDPTPDVQLRTPERLLDKVQAEDTTAGSQTYTYTINVYSQQHLGEYTCYASYGGVTDSASFEFVDPSLATNPTPSLTPSVTPPLDNVAVTVPDMVTLGNPDDYTSTAINLGSIVNVYVISMLSIIVMILN